MFGVYGKSCTVEDGQPVGDVEWCVSLIGLRGGWRLGQRSRDKNGDRALSSRIGHCKENMQVQSQCRITVERILLGALTLSLRSRTKESSGFVGR